MSKLLVLLVVVVTMATVSSGSKPRVSFDKLMDRIEELTARVQNLERREQTAMEPKHRQRRATQNVAFFVRLNMFVLDHLAVNQQIVLDDVVVNVGGGYDKQRGAFLAPVAGLYSFSTSIMSNMDNEVHVVITRNGSEVAKVNARGSGGRHDQGSQTVLLQLQSGDEILLKIKDYSNESLWGDKYTTFSGYLISPASQQ